MAPLQCKGKNHKTEPGFVALRQQKTHHINFPLSREIDDLTHISHFSQYHTSGSWDGGLHMQQNEEGNVNVRQ